MSAPSSTDMTSKNTKTQILEAYQQVLKQLEEKAEQDPQQKQKVLETKEVLLRSTKNSEQTIISNFSDLKTTTTQQIDHLSEQLMGEFNRLTDLQKSILIEQEHLESLYGIKETTHTLSALLISQEEETEKHHRALKESQQTFDHEMAEQKLKWDKKLQALEENYKDVKDELDKKRIRDEEEYSYRLETSRRKDEDEYQVTKTALEKECLERKAALDQRALSLQQNENEFAQLKKRVDGIPAEISQAIEKTKEKVSTELEGQFKFRTELTMKEVEGDRNLSQQKIVFLENKIKEQQVLINALTAKADEATRQVKSIACQALDTSSDRLRSFQDKKMDQERSSGSA